MTLKSYLHKYRSILITFILFMTPLLGVFFLALLGKLYSGTDITFHWQRFLELRYDLGHEVVPQFMNHAGSPLGNAVNIFYPYGTLLPFILLTWFVRKPVDLVYSIYFLIWYSMSLSSYFSSRSYFRSRKTGLVFSILYTACSTISNTLLLDDDIGQALSFICLPLILFGFLWILRDGSHWPLLCFGMIALFMSHVLTSLMMMALLSFLGICNFKRIVTHAKVWISYVKAVVLTVMCTAVFWMPLVYIITHNRYFHPGYKSSVKFWMSGLLWCRSGAFIHENCGFIDGVGIIVGLIGIYLLFTKRTHHLHIPLIDWEIWGTGIFYWLCNANIGWIHHIFAATPLSIFQFSFRTALPLHICFTYVAVKYLCGFYTRKAFHHERKYKRIYIALALFLALFMQLGNQMNDKLIYQQRALYTSSRQCLYGLRMKKIVEHHPQGRGFTLDNKSFKHMRNTSVLQDYQPLNTTGNANLGQRFVGSYGKNGLYKKHISESRNGVILHNRHTMYNVVLPLLWYRGYPARVTDHTRHIHWIRNKHENFIQIPTLRPGNHLLQMHPKVNVDTNIALILTDVGWILFLCVINKYLITKFLNESRDRYDGNP